MIIPCVSQLASCRKAKLVDFPGRAKDAHRPTDGRFRRGMERILKVYGSPGIPMNIDGIWGAIFSFSGGKFLEAPAKDSNIRCGSLWQAAAGNGDIDGRSPGSAGHAAGRGGSRKSLHRKTAGIVIQTSAADPFPFVRWRRFAPRRK